MSENTKLRGTIDRLIFHNPDGQWTVAALTVEEDRAITIVGALPGITVGETVQIEGAWVDDRRYGRQFRVSRLEPESPNSIEGIERYLGSGLIDGVGPEFARRIVGHFGADTLEIIEREPDRLREVAGIGEIRARKISASWSDKRDLQQAMIFLQGHGVAGAQAMRIFERYRDRTVEKVRDNPYRLATDVWGIGFRTADAIARRLGVDARAPERIDAGILYLLTMFADRGHTVVPFDELCSRGAAVLEVDLDLVEAAVARMVEGDQLVSETLGHLGRCLSSIELWEDEHVAASTFAAVLSGPLLPVDLDTDAALRDFERDTAMHLSDEQRRAVDSALTHKCTVLTGGPGVGKTTIVRAIVYALARCGKRVALAAPTGRAAKRLAESAGIEARTLHRLLEYQPMDQSFGRGIDQPLREDVVIIDEASMIDISLFRAVVLALEPSTQLVLVGDVNQLPSVGPGSVLADVISSGVVPVVRLRHIFRQAHASAIVRNAHRINDGEMPDLDPPVTSEDVDFFFIERGDPQAIQQMILHLGCQRIPARFGLDPLRDIQVLTPMHRGVLGTIDLNVALQARLNPGAEGLRELSRGGRVFRPRDKVMQIKNDYERDVFNGDIGVIRAIGSDDEPLVVELLDGRTISYDKSDLDALTHAYAISIHKSQGSEYPCVVMPFSTQHYVMLRRNLLYTAVTRGRRLVCIVGTRKAVAMALANDSADHRWTWLGQRIEEAFDREPL